MQDTYVVTGGFKKFEFDQNWQKYSRFCSATVTPQPMNSMVIQWNNEKMLVPWIAQYYWSAKFVLFVHKFIVTKFYTPKSLH